MEDINGLEKAIQVTERILKDFQTPFIINNSEVFISTSIGIALATKNYNLAADLLRDADIAMYQAKAQGRNSYKIFDAQMHTQAVKRLTLETELRQAIKKEEFIVHYQPIFDIFSGTNHGIRGIGALATSNSGVYFPR